MESSILPTRLIEELKNSFSSQKIFIENFFSELLKYNDDDMGNLLNLLIELLNSFEFPFAMLLNNQNYIEILVMIFYECKFNDKIQAIFNLCISKLAFEDIKIISIPHILSSAELVEINPSYNKRTNNISYLEGIYLEYKYLCTDCNFLMSFIVNNPNEELEESNIRDMVLCLRAMINNKLNLFEYNFPPYIYDFLQDLISNLYQYEEFFLKYIKDSIESDTSSNNEKIIIKKLEYSKDPKLRTSFYLGELIQVNEGLNIEYKNYRWPLSPAIVESLKKQICGFLNSQGGRIYIGVSDDQIVKGVYLDSKAKDLARNEIFNLTKDFFPKCRINKIEVLFLSVRNSKNETYIPNLWVIKIIIKQGEIDKLYSTTSMGFNSYIRMPGQCVYLSAEEIFNEILKRSNNPKEQIDESEFLDKEPEIPLQIKENKFEVDKIFGEFKNNIKINKIDKKSEKIFTISVQSIPNTANKDNVINIFKDTKYMSERVFVNKDGSCSGWAFFNYSTENEALNALKKIKGSTINGVKLSFKLKDK